jgi:hypothetical protein
MFDVCALILCVCPCIMFCDAGWTESVFDYSAAAPCDFAAVHAFVVVIVALPSVGSFVKGVAVDYFVRN